MPEERWLTTGEAAREVGVHPSTINRYVRDGELQPTTTTPGGHHRWTLTDLTAQLHALREAGQEQRARDEALRREAHDRDQGRDAGR